MKLFNIFCVILINLPALAQESHSSESPHKLEHITVLGNYDDSSLFDVVQNATTLTGDNLLKKQKSTLGETLRNEVGVTSSGYGPNASRPIIRGLDGDRIRILQNGLGVLDASGASQDHALPIDPLMMDNIEIVRGPLSLLYGSSAIGGVVNVITNRTHDHYDEGFHGAIDSQLTSVDNGKSVGAKMDYGINRWMFHADGNFRDSQDLKINGYARSERLRAQSPLPLDQEANDRLRNSANQTRSGAIGSTHVGEKNIIGLSASTYSSDYGVVAEPNVQIAMEQSRFDLSAEFKDIGLARSLRIKSAQSIYKHQEIESGATGTTFKNNGNETRLEFVQKKTEKLSGIFGLQSNIFNFSALGDEAFLPETKNSAQALFAFQDYKVSDTSKITLGGRAESNRVEPKANGRFTQSEDQNFFLASAALGYLHNINDNWSISSQLSYNERAPNYQELFANGAHVATFTYQVGDSNLQKESGRSIDLSLRYKNEKTTSSLTVFGQRFHHYISLNPTGSFDDTDESGTAGDSTEDLAIFNYTQQNAQIYGLELESQWHSIVDVLPGRTDFYLKADYLRGKNTDTGFNLPRMTPPRASIGFSQTWNSWNGDIELQHVFEQTQTAPLELATDGFTQVNMGMMYKMMASSQQISFFARAQNIFDVEARNHSSILKDLAQMGGRNFSLGIRAYF